MNDATWEREMETASRVARLAGELLREKFGTTHAVSFKGAVDLVTEADLAAETLIREELGKSFPGDPMLGEEGGGGHCAQDRIWVVDPLDGTTNYAHGLPLFSVSIALCEQGKPCAGAVYQPMLDELFHARRGGGAWRNGRRIAVSGRSRLDRSLAVTGFPYDIQASVGRVLRPLEQMLKAARGVRRLGSAAMDLCYVAAGIFDLFWEINLKPWDVAAGWLLVEEAGGVVTDFSGRPHHLERAELLACTPELQGPVIEILRKG